MAYDSASVRWSVSTATTANFDGSGCGCDLKLCITNSYEVKLLNSTKTVPKSLIDEALRDLKSAEIKDLLLYRNNGMQQSMGMLLDMKLARTELYKSAMISEHL